MELSEAIEKCRVDDVFLCEGPRPPQKGSLALIGHHLIFSPSCPIKSTNAKKKEDQELWVFYFHIFLIFIFGIFSASSSRHRSSPGRCFYAESEHETIGLSSFEMQKFYDLLFWDQQRRGLQRGRQIHRKIVEFKWVPCLLAINNRGFFRWNRTWLSVLLSLSVQNTRQWLGGVQHGSAFLQTYAPIDE